MHPTVRNTGISLYFWYADLLPSALRRGLGNEFKLEPDELHKKA
jgi:hypothetical protein